MIVVVLFAFTPMHLYANDEVEPVATPAADAARAEVLINRLEEIKNMDMTTLSRAEKKELRNEVRETKKELRANNSGVYISVGALLVVIILLILLL